MLENTDFENVVEIVTPLWLPLKLVLVKPLYTLARTLSIFVPCLPFTLLRLFFNQITLPRNYPRAHTHTLCSGFQVFIHTLTERLCEGSRGPFELTHHTVLAAAKLGSVAEAESSLLGGRVGVWKPIRQDPVLVGREAATSTWTLRVDSGASGSKPFSHTQTESYLDLLIIILCLFFLNLCFYLVAIEVNLKQMILCCVLLLYLLTPLTKTD